MEYNQFIGQIKKIFVAKAEFLSYKNSNGYTVRPDRYDNFQYTKLVEGSLEVTDTSQKQSMDRILGILELCKGFISNYNDNAFDGVNTIPKLRDAIYQEIWTHVKRDQGLVLLSEELKHNNSALVIEADANYSVKQNTQRRETYVLYQVARKFCLKTALNQGLDLNTYTNDLIWPISLDEPRGMHMHETLTKIIKSAIPAIRVEDIDLEVGEDDKVSERRTPSATRGSARKKRGSSVEEGKEDGEPSFHSLFGSGATPTGLPARRDSASSVVGGLGGGRSPRVTSYSSRRAAASAATSFTSGTMRGGRVDGQDDEIGDLKAQLRKLQEQMSLLTSNVGGYHDSHNQAFKALSNNIGSLTARLGQFEKNVSEAEYPPLGRGSAPFQPTYVPPVPPLGYPHPQSEANSEIAALRREIEHLSRELRDVSGAANDARVDSARKIADQKQESLLQMQHINSQLEQERVANARSLEEARVRHEQQMSDVAERARVNVEDVQRRFDAAILASENAAALQIEREKLRSETALGAERRRAEDALSKGVRDTNITLAESEARHREVLQEALERMQTDQVRANQEAEQQRQLELDAITRDADQKRVAAEQGFARQIQVLGDDANAKAEAAKLQQEALMRQIEALQKDEDDAHLISPAAVASSSSGAAFNVKDVLKAHETAFDEAGFVKDLSQIITALNKNYTKKDLYTLFSKVYDQGLKAKDPGYDLIYEDVKYRIKASRHFVEQFVILHVQKDEALDDIFGFVQNFKGDAEFYTSLLDHAINNSMSRADYSQVVLDNRDLFLAYFKNAERNGDIGGVMPAYQAINREEREKFDKVFENRSPDTFDKFQNGSNVHSFRGASSSIGKSKEEYSSDDKAKEGRSKDVPVPPSRENQGAYIEKPRVISTKEAAAASVMTATSVSLVVFVTAATTLATAGAGIIVLAAVAAAAKGYNYNAETNYNKQQAIGVGK